MDAGSILLLICSYVVVLGTNRGVEKLVAMAWKICVNWV